jgi:hydroxymethylpyrimidine pyrophosphatase-like HAD family hydrolase
MSTIRLIVCDVEGCITPPNRGIVVASEIMPIAAYCAAARNDQGLPPLVLCTGRQIPYAECVAQLIGAFYPGFPSIVENGAFLYDIANNDIIPNPSLKPDALAALREVREKTEHLMNQYGAKKEYGKEACISLNPPPGMAIDQFFEVARNALANWSTVVDITHSQSAVDITPAGIDKAAGMRCLAERTGISPDEMLGIGDTRGDMPMLKLVGVPTGPANASHEVREIASFIAPHPGPVGVADILRRFTAWE